MIITLKEVQASAAEMVVWVLHLFMSGKDKKENVRQEVN